jgi:hypothetical protein
MKLYSSNRLLKSLLPACVVLLTAMLACEVSPTNPNVPPVVPPMSQIFLTFLKELQQLPSNMVIAPLITEPQPPVNSSGTLTFRGYAPNSSDLKSANPPTVVLYEVMPLDCNGNVKRGEKLQSAPVGGNSTAANSSGNQEALRSWEMVDVKIPDNVLFVVAVLEVDGKEASKSEVLAVNVTRVTPVISSPAPDQKVGIKVNLTGNSLVGLCLTLKRGSDWVQDLLIGDPARVKQPGTEMEWTMANIPTQAGVNEFSLSLRGIPSIPPATIKLTQKVPSLVWPFGKMENGVYVPDPTMDCVMTWGGTNDFYIDNALSLGTNNHRGLDLDCGSKDNDLAVRAVADGTVIAVDPIWQYKDENGKDVKEYNGIYIAVDHGDWVSMYWHLENTKREDGKTDTAVDDPVKAGDMIGKMGKTGWATGVHLHLTAFWWGNINLKDPYKNYVKKNGKATIPSGAVYINLNKPDLMICPGINGLWNLDWTKVSVKGPPVSIGTTFNTCPTSKTVPCACSDQ